jgi:hypothetical protein
MTSWKGAAVLGVVLVALAVYAFASRPSATSPAAPVLFDCAGGQAIDFSVTGSDGRIVDARRDAPGNPWRLVAPAAAADGTAVDDLVFTAYSISASTTVKPAPPDSQVGLAPPALVVACLARGAFVYPIDRRPELRRQRLLRPRGHRRQAVRHPGRPGDEVPRSAGQAAGSDVPIPIGQSEPEPVHVTREA